MEQIQKIDLGEKIEHLIEESRRRTVTAVNTAMVYTYYEIGRMIVEDEQQGGTYAIYGKETLKRVSSYLIQRFGKGYSVDNLERMRKFYLIYSNSATPLRNSKNMQITSVKSNRNENSATVLRNSQISQTLSAESSQKGQTASDKLHFTLKYQTYLPSKEELQKLIEENISK
ncbi:MAG: hypothetical protein IKM79_02235 [Bacteroidales bacterium]|nr:hypothetical protein [Bacteroidales bacterium]